MMLQLSVAAVILLACTVNGEWVQTGGPPGGGNVTALLIWEGWSFTCVNKQLFVSSDKGAHWVKKAFPSSSVIVHFDIDSANVIASTTKGLFRSTDNGETWLSIGFPNQRVNSWARCGTHFFAGAQHGVYHSTNGENDWVLSGLSKMNVNKLLVKGEIVFAGTDSGVYKTENYGELWKSASNGLSRSVYVTDMIVSGDLIYAGFVYDGLYRSMDNGDTWRSADSLPMRIEISSLAIRDSTLIAATSGYQILIQPKGRSDITSVTIAQYTSLLSVCDTQIYIGTDYNGVYRAPDTWFNLQSMNRGFSFSNVVSIGVRGNELYTPINNEKGLYRSTDNGDTWAKFDSGLSGHTVHSFCIGENGVFAGTDGMAVYQLVEPGKKWIPRLNSNGNTKEMITAMAAEKNVVYAGGNNCDNSLFRSSDSGKTFSYIDYTPHDLNKCDLKISSLTFINSTLFLHGAGADVATCGIYSFNDGDLFSSVYLNSDLFRTASLVTMGSNVLFLDAVGTLGRISKDTTTVLSTFMSTGIAPCIIKSDEKLFTFGPASGIMVSTDGGSHWGRFSHGLTDSSYLTSIAVNEKYLFAGTSVSGVWRRPLSEISEATGIAGYQAPRQPDTKTAGFHFGHSTLSFNISMRVSGRVTIDLYDISGRMVRNLFSKSLPAGQSEMPLSTASVGAGCYIVRMQTGSGFLCNTIILDR